MRTCGNLRNLVKNICFLFFPMLKQGRKGKKLIFEKLPRSNSKKIDIQGLTISIGTFWRYSQPRKSQSLFLCHCEQQEQVLKEFHLPTYISNQYHYFKGEIYLFTRVFMPIKKLTIDIMPNCFHNKGLTFLTAGTRIQYVCQDERKYFQVVQFLLIRDRMGN